MKWADAGMNPMHRCRDQCCGLSDASRGPTWHAEKGPPVATIGSAQPVTAGRLAEAGAWVDTDPVEGCGGRKPKMNGSRLMVPLSALHPARHVRRAAPGASYRMSAPCPGRRSVQRAGGRRAPG